ncbi:hypothetical protein [Streptomyces sp. MJM1172]|uniref:hypothetical protein n=1 Tax=Streptomyces sp. MJM1172 TaxID=1703926 RepID=UPI00093CDE43|nr:hypothetical protein [Streptomyces sp. MJM1172]OKI49964.1 hypothetical protein AMK15_33205 [Streptomyces sp. MJM1172]
MSAPTHTRYLPAAAAAAAGRPAAASRRPAAAGANARLHWWALALPALAFGLLLLLLAGSAESHAAVGEASALLQVTEQLLRVVA